MEEDDQTLGNAGGTHLAAPTSTRCSNRCPEATYSFSTRADQTPGSPHSIHTDMDAAMEMGGLSMSSDRPDTHKVTPRVEAPHESTRVLSIPDLVSTITKSMMVMATEILERFTQRPQVDDATDATLLECLQEQRATAPQPMLTSMGAPSRQSTFDWLGPQAQTPQKEDQWAPRPEMTLQKVEWVASRARGQTRSLHTRTARRGTANLDPEMR